MKNLPNSGFPLLESDQAEVIEIFNELMRQWRATSNPAEALVQKPAGPPSRKRDLGRQWGIPNLD
ncbi:MAG TPA: hypothetical protein VLZ50_08000 [Terracidiphilus sp.]|nr:hypothetical protein [Terracidiphilus sp.]